MTDDERQAARRLLLKPIVLASADPELHRELRVHQAQLTAMFRTYLGYRLQVDGRSARLYKAGLGNETSRPLTRPGNIPFTPRDYAYLVLVCAVLLTARSQVLLSALVEDVRQASAEAGIDAEIDTLAERRALVHALRYLIELGAITEDAGSVSGFGENPTAEALLWIERDAVRSLVATPLRDADDAATLIESASAVGVDSIRYAVRRKLVENPVVMIAELPEAQAMWLRQDQRREARILEENFGLTLEIRAEGVAAIDPQDTLTDRHFPGEGTRAQAALLTVGKLVDQLAPAPNPGQAITSVAIPEGMIEESVTELAQIHRVHWSKELADDPRRLTADVEEMLLAVGLLRLADCDTPRLSAVAARYAPDPQVREISAEPTDPVLF